MEVCACMHTFIQMFRSHEEIEIQVLTDFMKQFTLTDLMCHGLRKSSKVLCYSMFFKPAI